MRKMLMRFSSPFACACRLGAFGADARGAAAIEYGLLVALLSVAIMATVFATGTGIRTTLYEVLNALVGG
ncbi:MAG TPA: Flp family type IVb pilin [Xanthobacteraceae bacterium]